MYALVDGNSFYCSCEQIFSPMLAGKPVVVLSNNDGAIVARNAEAKKWVQMGEPYFKVKDILAKHQTVIFSSNYELYGSLSKRMMGVLATFTPELEIYSIDEAFLALEGFSKTTGGRYDLHEYAKNIRTTVLQQVGIPTCVGIGPTKTLAKLANRLAKKQPGAEGVFILDTLEKQEAALRQVEVADVWGIGRQYATKLVNQGIHTAWELSNQSIEWARKYLGGIAGMRIIEELRGFSCIQMELFPQQKKAIACSRSFGKPVTLLEHLCEAVSTYITKAAEKLRKQGSCTNIITVFVQTSHYIEEHQQYGASTNVTLPVASDNTLELIHYALLALQSIYRPGPQYRKAGIIFNALVPAYQVQSTLFDTLDREKGKKLMAAIDQVNARLGANTVSVAKAGFQKKGQYWEMLAARRSPRYTTRLDELPIVKAC